MISIFLLFSLFSVGFSQKLISLSSFAGGNAINEFPFPAPYSIYISANSDSDVSLANIYIIDEDENQTPNDQMKTLTGVMYISTSKQTQDVNFHVIDIDNAQNVKFQALGAINSTILFLNTHSDSLPHNSAIISQWQQNEDVSVSIYPGFPTDSIEPEKTQIFSNPMHTDKLAKNFENVEMFSLTMVAFYLKTYKGVNFRIEPGYYTVDRTSTHADTTTGFYMRPSSLNTSLVTINTIKDNRYTGGSTGANILGHLSNGGTVTVAESGGASNAKFSTAPKDTIVSWSTPNNGNKLSIASTPRSTGQYYVQYFVDQGQLKQLSDQDEKPLQNQEAQHQQQ